MPYTLPPLGKQAVALPHFPSSHQAFIFRAAEYVPIETIAAVLKTTPDNVRRAARDMGLPDYRPGDVWLKKGYITIIRRMWHLLPYEQLLELLGMEEQELAVLMREEDFLDIKLSEKPLCPPITWRELTDEETRQTAEIRQVMNALSIEGKSPFAFEYHVPSITFEGDERIATRMIYAFSGLYQRAFDMDSEEFLPDEQLAAYRDLGINGIWTQGVLSQLAAFPFDPTVSAGYAQRLQRMRAMTERLARYGIKLYLYINEPRYMPLSFFERYPDLRGHVRGDTACLCTSTEPVQQYLRGAIESICRAVPLIGGFFMITRSENLTNCYSHAGGANEPCLCPRCQSRSVGEVVADTVRCVLEGAHRVNTAIQVFAWSWGWNEFTEDIIRHLPKPVILLSQSELDVPFSIGGIDGQVVDYSMSIPGPGERARREWRIARECGLEVGAKVQINTTWEASTVPTVPVSPSVDAHMQALQQEGVRHLLLSWTLGGYPCRNMAVAARYFFETCRYTDGDAACDQAEQQFSKAFREFPFHIHVLYQGPQNAGPSNLLFEKPTGYSATMTCFAYDDLDGWRSVYPPDTFEHQFFKLCTEWEKGLALLPNDPQNERVQMAWATYYLFRSSLDQIRFIRARDSGRRADAVKAARSELKTATAMLALMNQNAAIGYEAANHYYFSKGQLAEKIINCHNVIKRFSEPR